MPIFMLRFKQIWGGGGIYERSCLLFSNDINIKRNEIGKEILTYGNCKDKANVCRS